MKVSEMVDAARKVKLNSTKGMSIKKVISLLNPGISWKQIYMNLRMVR